MSINSIIPKPITEYDLRLLRIFVSVVEHGGFSAAEKALGITRSTISVHMSNLETRMKLKLCIRGRGGFSLTEEGQLVYRAVISLFDSLNDFSLMVGTLGKELSGEIVILCADQLDTNKQKKLPIGMPHNLRAVSKKYPLLFKSVGEFLGTGTIQSQKMIYKSLDEHKTFVKKKGFKTFKEYQNYLSKNRNTGFVYNPQRRFKKEWKGWVHFLGTGDPRTYKDQFSFEEARKFVRSLKISYLSDWEQYKKNNELPYGMPRAFYQVFKKNKKWKGWADFLGKKK